MNKVSRLRSMIQEQFANDDLENAAEIGEALLREHEVNHNEKTMSYADDLFNLACIYDALGIFDRAIFLYYESAREVIAMDGESLAYSFRLNNLAALLNASGHNDHAYYLLKQATAIMRTNLHPADSALADGIYNMANAAADMGKAAEAMRFHHEALKMRKDAGASSDIADSLLSMAFIHEDAKDNKRALKCASEALEELSGDDYYSTGYYLAGLCDACDKFERSEELYRGILKWVEEQGGREHSAFINVSLRLGQSLAQLDRPREALEVFKEIHDIFLDKNGENHMFFANCLRSMGILYRQLEEPDEAERVMLKSIHIRRGNNSSDLFEDKLFLLDMYLDENRQDKALDLLVYILMKNGASDVESIKTITESFIRKGKQKIERLLPLMEQINNRDSLRPIIERWEEWEKNENGE